MGTIVWTHANGTASEDGILIAGSGNANGTKVVNGGGYAEPHTGDTTHTDGTGAHGMVTIASSWAAPSFGTPQGDTSHWILGFAASPGTPLRTHVWCELDD